MSPVKDYERGTVGQCAHTRHVSWGSCVDRGHCLAPSSRGRMYILYSYRITQSKVIRNSPCTMELRVCTCVPLDRCRAAYTTSLIVRASNSGMERTFFAASEFWSCSYGPTTARPAMRQGSFSAPAPCASAWPLVGGGRKRGATVPGKLSPARKRTRQVAPAAARAQYSNAAFVAAVWSASVVVPKCVMAAPSAAAAPPPGARQPSAATALPCTFRAASEHPPARCAWPHP